MSGGGGDESVTAISSAKAQMCPASGCTILTTHLKKYGSLLFMVKIVANDMPWENRNLF